MAFPSRLSVVQETIDDILRRLDAMPASAAVDNLRAKAKVALAEAASEGDSDAGHERLMKGVIALHFAVMKLEKAQPK